MPVRRATRADLPHIAAVLAAAFSSDPPMTYLLAGTRERREALLGRYFTAILPLHLKHGITHVTPHGAALWVAPGRWPFAARDQARTLPTIMRVFGRHPVRALRAMQTIESGHPHEPHWYLDYIGVQPHAQGAGAGGRLLQAMLADCDAARVPAYLNAGSARSRDLYARHGFVASEEFTLPPGGPPLWRMWREPRGGTR